MSERPIISVIIPMLNEKENAVEIVKSVISQLSGESIEVWCVDDGSTDGTDEILLELERDFPVVNVLTFSRNFGKEVDSLAGLEASRGSAALLLDADMQHPPQILPELISHWRDGFDVVEAVKINRAGESWFRKISARWFYRLLGDLPAGRMEGSSDFKLLDRQVVDAVLALPEKKRFFRGLVAWVGFRVKAVPFHVPPRVVGQTSWTTAALVRYAIQNVVSFTSFPLRVVGWVGVGTVAFAVILGVQTYWNWATGVAVTGFTTVILSVSVFSALILACLGVIAFYLAQIYDEQKHRSAYIIRRDKERSGS